MQTPKLTVDVIVRMWKGERFRGIVLIERRNEPLGWALPGGFVDLEETTQEAAVREMREEIGLEVRLIRLLGVYSDPSRDPRFHTASAVYVGDADGDPRAASDARTARIFLLEELPLEELVFDHRRILLEYLRQ